MNSIQLNVVSFPPFAGISLTLLEMPFIDFSFSIAGVDVMSIGTDYMGVGKPLACSIGHWSYVTSRALL